MHTAIDELQDVLQVIVRRWIGEHQHHGHGIEGLAFTVFGHHPTDSAVRTLLGTDDSALFPEVKHASRWMSKLRQIAKIRRSPSAPGGA
ncbi:MAG: hypothetical protein JRE56_10785 [Deltaproteobacteria bacterium]|nr:hypothetical protein [Deltaproteobacteria bacterium]